MAANALFMYLSLLLNSVLTESLPTHGVGAVLAASGSVLQKKNLVRREPRGMKVEVPAPSAARTQADLEAVNMTDLSLLEELVDDNQVTGKCEGWCYEGGAASKGWLNTIPGQARPKCVWTDCHGCPECTQAAGQTTTAPPSFYGASKHASHNNGLSYGDHVWLLRSAVEAAGFCTTIDCMKGKQVWIGKADGSLVDGPKTITHYNPSDGNWLGDNLVFFDFRSQHLPHNRYFVGDYIHFHNPASLLQRDSAAESTKTANNQISISQSINLGCEFCASAALATNSQLSQCRAFAGRMGGGCSISITSGSRRRGSCWHPSVVSEDVNIGGVRAFDNGFTGTDQMSQEAFCTCLKKMTIDDPCSNRACIAQRMQACSKVCSDFKSSISSAGCSLLEQDASSSQNTSKSSQERSIQARRKKEVDRSSSDLDASLAGKCAG